MIVRFFLTFFFESSFPSSVSCCTGHPFEIKVMILAHYEEPKLEGEVTAPEKRLTGKSFAFYFSKYGCVLFYFIDLKLQKIEMCISRCQLFS